MLLLLAAATLFGADPAATPAATPAPAPARAAPPKKICRTYEVTGSRMGKDRICKTEAEWQDEDLVRSHEVEEAQRIAASQR
ncbi:MULTISPECIES: hypothetical protein [Sphingomonas]|uniref:hypothetical protein n=1 Tax=Sphingomonas TaxID=13687 RepID=UPI00126A3A05|nr:MULTISPECIES: hypothetical protein [Sphingomonas]